MNKKRLNNIIIIALAFLVSIGGVAAATNYFGSEVAFENAGTGLSAENVQDAIDEIYLKTVADKSCKSVSEPVIKDGLIPVNISASGVVTYADTTKNWYNYCDKVWANAVILNDDSEEYTVGSTISEDDIEAYFVWIPKYKYKLWNVGTTSAEVTNHTIEVIFDTENTTDTTTSCATPMVSGESGNCENGMYMTHPAFISMDVNGFWVGKFETGYNGATSTATAQVSSNDSSKIIVKPNVYSWRSNTVMNMFVAAYNYNENLNSHMMKNTEWGAVSYLSHSKYGINKEVNINNNSSYKTGYSALLTTQQGTYPGVYGDGSTYNNAYNTTIGYLASTTGNISGVYDMSGGAHEYMASYMAVGSSGFTTTTIANYDSKYFDIYSTKSSVQGYTYRILGDATGEMGPFWTYNDGDGSSRYHNSWYGDHSSFVESSYPWFTRGGYYGSGVLAGTFGFIRNTGGVNANIGSRLVLAP